jgi:hypothetical protein
MLIDTFPAFLEFWSEAKARPLDEQVEAWAKVYLSAWPELLEKQVEDYRSQHLDWRGIAREKVFPFIPQRLDAMCLAHQNLLSLCAPTLHKAELALSLGVDPMVVIYVGIGCGAGWVTTFQKTPALLFGLENIAECGWERADALTGLIAHELGHVAHQHWRAQAGRQLNDSALAQLFDEGFAQVCESLILRTDSFHQGVDSKNADWFSWCQAHQAFLAREFLCAVDAGESVSSFFGSWFEIEGHSETGYFLGHAVIKALLERGLALREIAVLEPQEAARPILEEMTM